MKENILYLKKTWGYFKKCKKEFILLCILGLVFSLISAILPILDAKIVTSITNNLMEQLLFLGFSLIVIQLIHHTVVYFMDRAYFLLTGKIVLMIRRDVASAILNLEVKNFDNHNSGTFVKRLDNDPYELARIFNSIRNTITNILTNIAVFGLIFIVNIYVGMFFVLGLIILYIVHKKRVTVFNKSWQKYKEIEDKTSGIFQEILKGTRDIKVLGLKEPFMNYTQNALKEVYEKNYKIEIKDNFYWTVGYTVRDIFQCLFLLFGAFLVLHNLLKPTEFIVLYMYKKQLFDLVHHLSNFAGDFQEFIVAAKRIFEVTDYTSFSKEKFGKKQVKRINGDIEFKNVTFEYQENLPIIKDLNLKIPANDTIAIVGKSGEGKTTLFSLLSRLYDVKTGDILIDGVSIYELDEETLRHNVSIITQNPYVFNMTIKENLKLVNPGITDEEMIEKCKLACIHDYIEKLPDKYDTLIGEGGINLSGGQKQRLAIARALIKDSEIILFDEATSALDNETQAEIQKSIMNISKDYTILIVAHRLSTIEFCNRIVVLSEGKVNGIGSHKQLLEKNKIYHDLYHGNLE